VFVQLSYCGHPVKIHSGPRDRLAVRQSISVRAYSSRPAVHVYGTVYRIRVLFVLLLFFFSQNCFFLEHTHYTTPILCTHYEEHVWFCAHEWDREAKQRGETAKTRRTRWDVARPIHVKRSCAGACAYSCCCVRIKCFYILRNCFRIRD